jgi:hypothetical protein
MRIGENPSIPRRNEAPQLVRRTESPVVLNHRQDVPSNPPMNPPRENCRDQAPGPCARPPGRCRAGDTLSASRSALAGGRRAAACAWLHHAARAGADGERRGVSRLAHGVWAAGAAGGAPGRGGWPGLARAGTPASAAPAGPGAAPCAGGAWTAGAPATPVAAGWQGSSAGARRLALERSNRYACLRGYRLRVSVAAGEASPPDCHSASAGLPGTMPIVRGRAPNTPAEERSA